MIIKKWIFLTLFQVIHIFVHEEYNSSFLENDIAMLVLNSSVQITAEVRPVCLWNSGDTSLNNIIGKNGVVRSNLQLKYIIWNIQSFNYLILNGIGNNDLILDSIGTNVLILGSIVTNVLILEITGTNALIWIELVLMAWFWIILALMCWSWIVLVLMTWS